jgi:hypothetical protein
MNDKLIKSLIAIIGFVVGGAVGIYKTTLDYESHIQVLKAEFNLALKQTAYDTRQDIMQYIQNNILTRPKEN